VAASSFQQPNPARTALGEIVAEHGPGVLSEPARLGNLLSDLLPDDQPVVRMLVAAAEDRVAESLREHVAQGMDAATAARLAGASFADRTMFSREACLWIAGEMALALGLLASGYADAAPPPEVTVGAVPRTQTAPLPRSTSPRGPQPAARGRRRATSAGMVAAAIVVAGVLVAGAIFAVARGHIEVLQTGNARRHATGPHHPSASPSHQPGSRGHRHSASPGTPDSTSPATPIGYQITAALNPGAPGSMTSVAWIPGTSIVAVGDKDGSVYLWDAATGRPYGQPFTVPGGRQVFAIAISPDGTTLAAGDSAGTTYLWNIATRQPEAALRDPGPASHREVDSLAFSHDGRMLVSADGNGAANLWVVDPAHQPTVPALRLLDPAGSGVWSAVFSSDDVLATGDYSGNIYLWDPRTGADLGHLVIPGGISVTALAFSTDGITLAAATGRESAGTPPGSGDLYLFRTATHAGQFIASVGAIWALQFAGHILAAASGGGQTFLWTVSTGSLDATSAGTLPDPDSGSQGVGTLGYSPDGKWLVTGDTNGQAYVWQTG